MFTSLENMARKEDGIALVSTLGIIAMMSVMMIGLMSAGLSQLQATESFQNRITAFHWAEGAIDETIVQLKTNSSYTGLTSTAVTGMTSGSYSTTVTSSPTNTYIKTITATAQVGQNATSYGYQQRVVTAVVDLTPQSLFPAVLFADQRVTMNGNAQSDAYDSSVGPYNAATATSEGHVGTNGTGAGVISLNGNAIVKGNATAGPGANIVTAITLAGNAAITGNKQTASTTFALPSVSAPAGIPSSGSLSINGNSVVTLAGGTYYYSALSINGNGKLKVTGSAIIYVNGDVSINGNGVGTASNLPTNLTIKVIGSRNVSLNGNANFYGAIYAPDCQASINGNGQLYGAVVADRIDNNGNGNLHYDKALGSGSGSSSSCTLKSWSETY